MAANMIGVRKRIIAFDNEGSYMVMFNPRDRQTIGRHTRLRKAACRSRARGKPAAGSRSRCSIRTRKFQIRLKTFTGWTAQIIQHEIDHCNGIII